MFAESTIASIIISGNRLGDGCSLGAAAVRPDRDSEPVVSALPVMGRCVEGFPRGESGDGSSPFFIVRPFPSALAVRPRYYDLC
jgi:hypothetical protein